LRQSARSGVGTARRGLAASGERPCSARRSSSCARTRRLKVFCLVIFRAPLPADGLKTHALDAPPERATTACVPMARGHLYLPKAGGVSAGTEVGRGTAPSPNYTARTAGTFV